MNAVVGSKREASSWVYRYLVENISKNELSTMITGINKAVSDKNGDIVSFYSDEKVFGKGSMSPVFSNKDTKVETITIDHLVDRFDFSRVDVIKIDIEGFEFFAFKGGGKLLEGNNAPMILFEFVDWAERHAGIAPGEAQRFLITKGYMLYQLLLDGSLQIQESILENGTAMFIASKKKLL